MERLTPIDDWFLAVEDGIDHMHMALVAVLEGPCPTIDELRADMEARLDRIPRYRQRVVRAPFDVVSPVWADDTKFDITRHVRAMALHEPCTECTLAELVGEVVSDELDRNHPLWDICVVEGLPGDEWAAIIRVHHSLTDGVGGSELLTVMVDADADAEPPAPSQWQPTPPPAPGRLVAEGIRRQLRLRPLARAARSVITAPRRAASTIAETASGLVSLGRELPPTSKTILNGRLGPMRTWACATTSMASVDRIRDRHDVTINDIALSAILGGFAELLATLGEPVDDRDVRCLVPVNLRSTMRDGVLHNHVAAMVSELPLGIADVEARLEEVHRRMNALKASHEADATAHALEVSQLVPYLPLATAFRIVAGFLHRFGQRNVNTVTTNVPGPPIPLYWMGRQILRGYPVTPIGEAVRLGVAIHSYNGLLTFGVTSDRTAIPDVGPVVDGIERDMAAMAAIAPVTPAP